MIIRRLLVLSAASLITSMIAAYAGPCSPEIERMQARVDARVEVAAGAGPSAAESSDARLSLQIYFDSGSLFGSRC
jgi:hypothetical protein